MIKISELSIKRIKGQAPESVSSLTLIENSGVDGDIFSVGGDRQVSILFAGTKDELRKDYPDEPCTRKFTCNIVIEGRLIPTLRQGNRLRFGNVCIELTQIGRQCHNLCEIGKCPLTDGAIFAKVISGGIIKVGDEGSL